MGKISPPNYESSGFMPHLEHFCPHNVKAGDLSDFKFVSPSVPCISGGREE